MRKSTFLTTQIALLSLVAAPLSAETVKVDGMLYEIMSSNTVRTVPDMSGDGQSNAYRGEYILPSQITVDGKKYTLKEIGAKTFRNCGATSVTIPRTVSRIGKEAFAGFLGTKMIIPSGVRTIEENAFAFARVTDLTVSDGLDSIGTGGLGYLNSLDTLRLPASVRAMAPGALHFSHKLVAIVIDPANPYWKSVDGVVYSKNGTVLFDYPCYKFVEPTFEVPSGVKTIEKSACSYLDRQQSFTLPVSIEDVREKGFASCMKMREILGCSAIEKIGKLAFMHCTDLESFTLGWAVERIDSAAFVNSYIPVFNTRMARSLKYIEKDAFSLSGIKEFYVPASLQKFNPEAFTHCPQLTAFNVALDNPTLASVDGVVYSHALDTLICMPGGFQHEDFTIPSTVKYIGYRGCYYTPVRIVHFPDGFLGFGDQAFKNSDLMYVNIPPTVTTLPYECFSYSGMQEITVPETVTSMGGGVFSGCQFLKKARLPENLDSVAPGTFWACTALESVNVPSEARVIDYNAYANCFKLTEIVIPDKVEKIGQNAFRTANDMTRAGQLSKVTFGRSLKEIGSLAFDGQYSIKSLTSYNPEPPVFDGVVFGDPVYKKAQVSVDVVALTKYKSASGWSRFQNWNTFSGIEETAISADEVIVEGRDIILPEGAAASIWSMDGRLVYTGRGERVAMPDAGIYIIRVGNSTFKKIVK